MTPTFGPATLSAGWARWSLGFAKSGLKQRDLLPIYKTMRNKIFGIVGVVWGGAVILYTVLHGISGGVPYAIGSVVAVLFGVAMLIAADSA